MIASIFRLIGWSGKEKRLVDRIPELQEPSVCAAELTGHPRDAANHIVGEERRPAYGQSEAEQAVDMSYRCETVEHDGRSHLVYRQGHRSFMGNPGYLF